MTMTCELDHLVLGAHTLAQGATFVEALLGVKPQPGGAHAAMGTHNLVLRLGAHAYLEVIAIDPAATAPARPRWFGLDAETTRRRLRDSPCLLTWAARTQDIDTAARGGPLSLGTIHSMSRGAYAWRITIPDDGALIGDGLIPAVIQWDGDTHPVEQLGQCGCELVTLEGMHPAPGSIAPALAALGLERTLAPVRADHARLVAAIRCPLGIRTISS